MRRRIFALIASLATLILFSIVSLTAAGRAAAHSRASQVAPAPSAPALSVHLFAAGAWIGHSRPDPIVVTRQHVFIAYQNDTPPTASTKQSTIVEYSRAGAPLHSINITGRCDGLRWNPYTKTLWATVNEDANPGLYVITPQSGAVKRYAFVWPTAHGGGYDDLAFANGKAFAAASNPTLNAQGINTAPAVVSVTLTAGGIAAVSPILAGNALVKDTTTGTFVHIDAIDPDSLVVAPNGDVVLVDQAGLELVLIANAGLAAQSATRIPTGTQLDDADITRSVQGELFVVDGQKNATYIVTAPAWPLNEVWTEAPSDSGVAGFVGTLDLSTGNIIPRIIGFGSPTGLLWVDDRTIPDEGR